MAKRGASAGAKPMNQAWGAEDSPGLAGASAVPVLPATVWPGTAAAVPVPLRTTATIIAVTAAAVVGDTARFHSSGPMRRMTCPSSSRISRTTWGAMSTPPLAMAPATVAICRGVTATSPWPMAALAKLGLFLSNVPGAGPPLRDSGRSKGTSSPIPKARIPSTSFSPRSRPICPNVVLQDRRKLSAIDPPHRLEPKLRSSLSDWGRSRDRKVG